MKILMFLLTTCLISALSYYLRKGVGQDRYTYQTTDMKAIGRERVNLGLRIFFTLEFLAAFLFWV